MGFYHTGKYHRCSEDFVYQFKLENIAYAQLTTIKGQTQ
jgi:hypothetical protein